MTPATPPPPLFSPGDVITVAGILLLTAAIWFYLSSHL